MESEDSLVQSFASNQSYMARNKFITKTSVTPDISSLKGVKEKAEEGKENDFNREVKEQNEQINVYLKIEEIDEAMRYKRNVSVFLNVQCNNFFTNTSEILPEFLFHSGLFILLYHQIKIHSSIREELHQKKPPSKLFRPEIWDAYQISIPFQRIVKLIDSDLKHLESYFKEVKTRIDAALKNPQLRSKHPDFVRILEDYYNASREGTFHEEAYEALTKTLISEVRKSEKKVKDRRLFSKLAITVRPFRYLREEVDFGLFYEKEEEELEKLRAAFPEL